MKPKNIKSKNIKPKNIKPNKRILRTKLVAIILITLFIFVQFPLQAAPAGPVEICKLNVKLSDEADIEKITSASGGEILRTGPLNYLTLQFNDYGNNRQKVLALPGVLSAEWSKKYRIEQDLVSPSTKADSYHDPYYSEQWNLKKIRAPELWAEGVTGRGIVVAVVDTGVDLNFPDLVDDKQNNLLQGYTAFPRSTKAGAAQDDNGHGTAVAGTIAALPNDIGTIGIAYEAQIMPIKAMDEDGEGDDDVLADGIVWAADHGAHIINLSIGSSTQTQVLADALAYAASKGCLLVGASGNNKSVEELPITKNLSGVNYPAADPCVIAVTAIDQKDKIAHFSLTGPEVKLSAPGTQILSCMWTKEGEKGVGYFTGTSFAAPLVSGVAALLWSQYPELTASEISRALFSSAFDLGSSGRDHSYGYGRVDAYRALKTLAEPKSYPSPAVLGWEGGKVKAADGEEVQAVLTVPPGAFNLPVYSGSPASTMKFQLELVSSPPNFPQGIKPAGRAVSIKPWGESTVQKPLSLQLKLTPPQEQALSEDKESNSAEQIAYLYRWSGSRWLRVGGGLPLSASTLEVTIYEPGLYRAGWSAAPATNRISGSDRISTALAIAREAFPTGADTVVLSRADSYPDALAGVPLAYRLQAPILLTNPQSLPAEVEQLIIELAPRQIIILGGKSAVAPAIEERLGRQAPVTRLAGGNRYETATVIAHTLGTKGQAVVVSGSNFPDAIAAASAAAQTGSPILLTPASSLAPSTANTLNKLSVVSTEVVGGTGVVNHSVWSKLPEPQRISGPDRYATSAAVVQAYQPQGGILYVATGRNFPDALTGGVLAAANSSAILLLPPQGLTAPQIQALQTLNGKKAVALGGRGAVSDQLLKQVQELIN